MADHFVVVLRLARTYLKHTVLQRKRQIKLAMRTRA